MPFTNETKSSNTFTNESISGSASSILAGMPIGLLLSLTYSANVLSLISWTEDSKSSSSWSNQAKN